MSESEEPAPWSLLTQALSEARECDGEEPPPLDLREAVEGSSQGGFQKTPLAQASNLLQLRSLAEGKIAGELSDDDYLEGVRKLLQPLSHAFRFMEGEAIQAQIEELPADQKALYEEGQRLVRALLEGMVCMESFGESNNLEDVREGLALVEKTFIAIDQLQDQALAKGQELEAAN